MIAALLLLLLAPDPRAEAEAQAKEALAAGEKLEALTQIETAMRNVESMREKARLRDWYRKVGWVAPPPVNAAEKLTLGIHVNNEKIRIYDRAAGRLAGQGKRRAAIILRRAIKGLAGGDRAKQEEEKIRRLIRDLTEKPSDEEKAAVAAIFKAKKLPKNILKAGRKLLEERRYRTVVRLCQEMMFGNYEQAVKNEAVALRKEAEERAIKDVSTDEKLAARAVLDDARFKRLDHSTSRHFLFLGPKKFVQGIPKKQRTELDLAYIFQSDLANTRRTHDGQRIVI
ncbi:MAG: hypothetical protein AAGD14_19515, partial [Planctomycetota bacterium]